MPINTVGGVAPIQPGSIAEPDQNVITVRPGEITISDVAKRLNVNKEALLAANPQLKDPYQKLQPGQELQTGKLKDKSSSKLYNAASSGKHFDKATL
jgi:LysM repeat protein